MDTAPINEVETDTSSHKTEEYIIDRINIAPQSSLPKTVIAYELVSNFDNTEVGILDLLTIDPDGEYCKKITILKHAEAAKQYIQKTGKRIAPFPPIPAENYRDMVYSFAVDSLEKVRGKLLAQAEILKIPIGEEMNEPITPLGLGGQRKNPANFPINTKVGNAMYQTLKQNPTLREAVSASLKDEAEDIRSRSEEYQTAAFDNWAEQSKADNALKIAIEGTK